MKLGPALLAMAVVAAACGTQEPPAAVTSSTAAASDSITATTPPVVVTPATTIAPGLAAAPWAVPPLPAEAAPSVLLDAWTAATNNGFCGALYPADANDLAADATVRQADFGADAWAVAWDRPEGPGRTENGEVCEDCGRGAFGVAGTTGLAPAEGVALWPDRIEWSDGSAAGYGLEGLSSPLPGAPHLAFLDVAGQGCLYNVWSFLGEDHLLHIIDELRFVEGMLAAVIEEDPTSAAEALGPAPWQRAPIGEDAVAQPLLDEWNEEVLYQATCPLLAPATLGDGTDGASARRATGAFELLAAWDLPGGPGRYGTGDYCANCGRGAVGIGTIARFVGGRANYEAYAVTHTWDDGSALRVISEATEFFNIPPERAEFTDPETGAAAIAPYNGYLLIPGLSCGYRLWSFLGPDHVVELAQNLRPVIDHGEQLFTEGACPGAPFVDFDGVGDDESFTIHPRDDGAALIICPENDPPFETFTSTAPQLSGASDLDGDGDVEILLGELSEDGAQLFQIWTDGEAGVPEVVFERQDGGALTLIDGVVDDVGYRWGCRDDGTVVQVDAALVGNSLVWNRTAYRVERLVAVVVGTGSGTTPVSSSSLGDAIAEDAFTELVELSRCGA